MERSGIVNKKSRAKRSELRIKDAMERRGKAVVKKEKKMNIGIDIDDTISKTSEMMDTLAKEFTEKELKREFTINEIEVTNPYWARDTYNWTEEESKIFFEKYYKEIMEKVEPKEDVIEIINKLAQKNRIIIITARWDNESKFMKKTTEEWFKKYQIHYDELYIGHKDKRQLVTGNNVEIFIDDNYQTCKEVSELNVRTLIMNSRLNKNIEDDKLERVFSWKEIEEKIIKEEN